MMASQVINSLRQPGKAINGNDRLMGSLAVIDCVTPL
jgi:hypothetical protein